MRARLLTYWESFHTSFWFVPGWFLAAGVAAAVILPWLEAQAANWIDGRLDWLDMSRDAAEATLSMIATSMITVSGVVFSVTVVSLSIVSSQFGSRVLRALIGDKTTQATIGLFLGTATFCFLLLRTMSLVGADEFVPSCSVSAAVVLTLVAMAALLNFIHHVAVSIQAPTIIDRLGNELNAAIDEVYPEPIPRAASAADRQLHREEEQMEWTAKGSPLTAHGDGYLQAVDLDALVNLAGRHEVCIELRQQVGEFVVGGEPIAMVYPGEKLDESLVRAARRAMVFGMRRTSWQDVSFAARELVEMGLRALSPGINDPFTAVTCLDRLGAAFRRIAERQVPPRFYFDERGDLRLVYAVPDLPQIMENCLSPLRQFGNEHLSVMLATFAAVDAVRGKAVRATDLSACRSQAERTWMACQKGLWQQTDLTRCQTAFRELTEQA